jgi:BASS family bile acid:Na+ symporter
MVQWLVSAVLMTMTEVIGGINGCAHGYHRVSRVLVSPSCATPMSAELLVRSAIVLSIVLIVFGFALKSSVQDATFVFRHPSLLLRSLLAMNVLLPLFAAMLARFFTLRPGIGVALVALAISPVPPFLPIKQLKLGAHPAYVFGLLGATALLAIVLAPLTVALIGLFFSQQFGVAPVAIAKMVGLSVLVPFALGLIVRRTAPVFAERASSITGKAGMLLLLVASVPLLIKLGPEMISLIGDGTVAAFVAFTLTGLAVGHLLGGPDRDHRAVLALATATRHPGVALAIATQAFPTLKVAPALMLYLVVCAIASAPYVLWCERRSKRLAAAT